MSKITRKEVKQAFINFIHPAGRGPTLCNFTANQSYDLGQAFKKVWDIRPNRPTFITGLFIDEPCQDELTYLCRALTLNILLDDNEELFK